MPNEQVLPDDKRKTHPIARAAHLLGCFYNYRAMEICREEGISDHDIRAGILLDLQRREQRYQDRIAYGSPEYGHRSGCEGAVYMVGEFYDDAAIR